MISMSEKQAWESVARKFEHPINTMGMRIDYTRLGICHVIDSLLAVKYITPNIALSMENKLRLYKGDKIGPVFFWPTYMHSNFKREYDLKRVELARKFAEECK